MQKFPLNKLIHQLHSSTSFMNSSITFRSSSVSFFIDFLLGLSYKFSKLRSTDRSSSSSSLSLLLSTLATLGVLIRCSCCCKNSSCFSCHESSFRSGSFGSFVSGGAMTASIGSSTDSSELSSSLDSSSSCIVEFLLMNLPILSTIESPLKI